MDDEEPDQPLKIILIPLVWGCDHWMLDGDDYLQIMAIHKANVYAYSKVQKLRRRSSF